ncbi:hypothetical protein ACFXNY_18985, partial [Streptomyces sindenensis]|uniref:hypothetical protein n=1 Tax=Streptomyces sindenensis TaxID=67363 RepID=UPI0036C5926C
VPDRPFIPSGEIRNCLRCHADQGKNCVLVDGVLWVGAGCTRAFCVLFNCVLFAIAADLQQGCAEL